MSQKFVIVDLGNSYYDFNVYPVVGDPFDRKNGTFDVSILTANGKARNVMVKAEDLFDTYEDAFKTAEIAFIKFGQKLAADVNKRFERNRKFCKEQAEKSNNSMSGVDKEIFKSLKAKIYKSSPYSTYVWNAGTTVNTAVGQQNVVPDASATTIEALQQQNIEIEATEAAQAEQIAELLDIQALENVLQNTPEA